jgi:hypothetical protein
MSVLFAVAQPLGATDRVPAKPNIVFILADDLGWGDLRCHGHPYAKTPQLWQREGRWFLSFGGVLDQVWVEKNNERLPAAVRGQRSHENYYYTLPALNAVARDEDLDHVAIPRGHYIMKVLRDAKGEDVAIFTRTIGTDSGISLPCPVSYDAGHRLQVHLEPKAP